MKVRGTLIVVMQKNFLKKICVTFCVLTFVFVPVVPVFAQEGLLKPVCDGPKCTFQDLVTTAQQVASVVVKVGLIIAPLIFAYAGYLYLMSGFEGNVGNRKKATGIFKNVVIGLIIMMVAWALVNTVLSALVCGVTNGDWFSVTSCQPNQTSTSSSS